MQTMASYCALLVALLLVAGALANDAVAKATPISKVLDLMNEMVAKGTAAKNDEAVAFAKFSTWCDNQQRVKQDEIDKGTATMEEETAKIEKAAALIKALTARIEELEEDVGRWHKDKASATEVREKEAVDYKATALDYTESQEAIAGALTVLKKQAYDRTQSEFVQALVQVKSSKLVPLATKKALVAFLQQPDVEEMPAANMDVSAPEAYSYEFQSGGVVEMLEKLKDEFLTKKTELDAEEMTAQHAFERIMQQLTDNIENAEHEISKKTTLRAETQKAKATAEGALAQATKDRAEDQSYLDETKALCTKKTADFESRQQLRADELVAIKQAMEIISSQSVAGSGEKHLPALLQLRSRHGVSLAQLRNGNQQSPIQARIAEFLAERAQKCNSRVLMLVSEQVAADPFTKVKKMIKDLMIKLMEEATAETEHKGWCDTELTTNKQTRDARTEDINELKAQEEDLTAEIAQLAQDIEDLTAAVKELEKAMAEATEDRMASKAKNEQTIKDAKAGQVAVEQAIAVLKDFYEKSAEATALNQQKKGPAEDAPETFDAPYTGMMPEGGNIVDFLEVILTDFSRLESETATSEATEADDYKNYMHESEKDVALKKNEKGHKSDTKADRESALHQTEEDLKANQEQLDKALAYYDKLKPTCVDSGITYEERVKRREEEIQSLQEALKILSGTDIDLD